MAATAVELGFKALNGEALPTSVVLLDAQLVTRDNVADFKGWEAARN